MRAHLELLSREVSALSRAMWTRFRRRRDEFRASTTNVKYARVDRFLDEESLRLVGRDHDARFNLSTVFLQIDTTEGSIVLHLVKASANVRALRSVDRCECGARALTPIHRRSEATFDRFKCSPRVISDSDKPKR
jgi:hypothetical protein